MSVTSDFFLLTSDFGAAVPRRVAFVGWLVTTRRAVTRDHQYMMFLTLEDRQGVVEALLFPDVYKRYGGEVTEQSCYRVIGTVSVEHGVCTLTAESVERLPLPSA